MKKLIIIILISILLLNIPMVTHAQQIGLSLSPSLHEITAKPNNTFELKFTLENIGDPALVSLKLVNSFPSDTFGNMSLKPTLNGPLQFNIKEYNIQNEKPFILKTKETKKLTLNIEVPEDVKEKDYYYSLIAQTSPPPVEDGSISARGSIGIASNILISVAKEFPADSKAKIVLFEIPEAYKLNLFGKTMYLVNNSNALKTILTVQNNEIHRIKPTGNINLIQTFGETKSYTLPPQNILAESQRTIQAELPYRDNDASLYLSSLKPGLYTLNTTLSLPVSSTTLESTVEFIALPFNLFNWLGLLIAVMMIIFFLYRKKNQSDFESD